MPRAARARARNDASPQSQLCDGAARKLRSLGENDSTTSGVRAASGKASTTRRYGRARSAVVTRRSAAPTAVALTTR
ncbi:MAG: hypothetical protein NZL88_03410, partial [Gaiellaceae bacterium]|nr:hypothetical protein [Gaiellaceae bacterium]